MPNKKFLLLIFLLCTLNIFSVNLKEITINITDDGGEWPPYTFYERINGKPGEKVIGFSVDVIKEIFEKNGIKFTIKLLPWARAQAEVEKGKKYHMFLSGSYSQERAKKFLISLPYYKTYGYYFYSKKNFPNGLLISSLNDLKDYKLVGLFGHNYTSYNLTVKDIYTGAKSFESAIKQLHAGYYEILPESLEILSGYSLTNKNVLNDKDLGYNRIPGMKPVEFHMMFSKNEIGAELKKIVDKGISDMKKSGRLDELMKKYMPK